MTEFTLPKTMRAWQYTKSSDSFTSNLHLNPSFPLPVPKPNQHLIRILTTALNPVDYKLPSLPILSYFIPKPATPCVDFSGIIVEPAEGSELKIGDRVFGCSGASPLDGGALREYNIARTDAITSIPEGVTGEEVAGVGVAGLTAYQSIIPKVKKGDRILILGGSGGVGSFGVQFAKIAGCHVTSTCSTRNIELVRSLGADVVVDYTKGSVTEQLNKGEKFNLIIDNVGKDEEIVWRCGELLKKGAQYTKVSGDLSLHGIWTRLKWKVWPGFLGGVKGKVSGFWPKPERGDLDVIAGWIKERRVKMVVDEKFGFEDAREAFEKVMSGRARGKILIKVCEG